MIGFVLLTIILRQLLDSSGPAPTFVPADVYSYHYSPAELSEFLSIEDFMPLESLPEAPPPQAEVEPMVFFASDEQSVFQASPETSEFAGTDD